MGMKLSRLGLEANAAHRAFVAALQHAQGLRHFDARPQGVRPRAAEFADALQLDLERRDGNERQRRVDIGRDVLGHIADETQRDVEIIALDPARAFEPLLQPRQLLGRRVGNFQRCEEADHDVVFPSPSLRGAQATKQPRKRRYQNARLPGCFASLAMTNRGTWCQIKAPGWAATGARPRYPFRVLPSI